MKYFVQSYTIYSKKGTFSPINIQILAFSTRFYNLFCTFASQNILYKRIMRPLILISNDDGYQAKGINELVNMIRDLGDIIVCAPEGGRSGKSRAFSTEMLMLRHVSTDNNVQVWACSGTPVDCVKMAYSQVCPRKPDMVIGGINHGDNASTNAHYSGTVGIVIEGAMKGIPSIAFSLCDYSVDADFSPMRQMVRDMVTMVLRDGLPHYVCLNVNYPKDVCNGIKVCRMAYGHWRNEVEKREHPRGFNYYWMLGYYQNDEPESADTDNWAISHGYASVTPITVDITAHDYIEQLTSKLSTNEILSHRR